MGLFKNISKSLGSVTKTIGSFIPGIGDADAARDANQTNIDQAEINRRFQMEMSNTAYQRGMADMKKAGLNPILAYMQGPASQPTGATATVSPESRTRLADMALASYTGVKNAATAKQTADQQGNAVDSSIMLNASTAKLNAEKAEEVRLKNVRNRKYEPIDDVLGKISSGAKNILDRTMKHVAKPIRPDLAPKDVKKAINKLEIERFGGRDFPSHLLKTIPKQRKN